MNTPVQHPKNTSERLAFIRATDPWTDELDYAIKVLSALCGAPHQVEEYQASDLKVLFAAANAGTLMPADLSAKADSDSHHMHNALVAELALDILRNNGTDVVERASLRANLLQP